MSTVYVMMFKHPAGHVRAIQAYSTEQRCIDAVATYIERNPEDAKRVFYVSTEMEVPEMVECYMCHKLVPSNETSTHGACRYCV